MFTVDDIVRHARQYQLGRMSLEEFENWFEDNSLDVYDSPELNAVRAAVDGALAAYHYDYIGEDALRLELANAIGSFAPGRNQSIVSPNFLIGTWKDKDSPPMEWKAGSLVSQFFTTPSERRPVEARA